MADSGGHEDYGIGLKLIDSWDHGLESRWGHE